MRCSKADVVALARSAVHGECEIRVAPAFVDERTRERLREAFARGDFTTWNYDDARADRAADPRSILAGAKSVLCIAFAYATPPPSRPRLSGRVSNYAWSGDYHRRLLQTLREIARRIDECAGEPVTAVACDTKPIAERAFAAKAGLGWIGKHTNLISPRLGSFVFLGEILTTLDIEPDAPLQKSCGSCVRCVDSCPTGALRGDYTIDATRCISDLTQRTDAIPREMRPLIGEWVWGCDMCQVACPPTHAAGDRGATSDTPRSQTAASPDLVGLLRLRAGEFRSTFRPTAMGWRGAAVLRRNAAVALGNALDRASVPALIEVLEREPHAMVRAHAAWALGRIGSPAALDGLRSHVSREGDAEVREEIMLAMNAFSEVGPR
ncbi:MAG TPA: tRNA epoxyqueuosine(34) reductase QueG [Candidatus Tyrphobacter sp.]